jgi:hypothetical protein
VISLAGLERDVLVVACAISAGIHAALTPDHFAEAAGGGVGFGAAAVLLTGLVVALTRWQASRLAVLGAAAVLAGLLASYVLATTTGVPLLHPGVESVTGLAIATKAMESVGLLGALHLIWHGRPAVAVTHLQPKGRLP